MSRKCMFILIGITTLVLAGCAGKPVDIEQSDIDNVAPTVEVQTEAEQQEVVAEEVTGPITSYLTGLETTKEMQQHRPLAVMLNNIKEGCPQSGIAQASIVYECPVEGRITRLMGIFEDYENVEKIGSIRSCRDYFVFFADEYDCIYCHFGQATPYVGYYLNSDDVDNISGAVAGIDRPATNTFYRSSDRKAPHNVYISPEGLMKDIEKFGYRTTVKEGYTPKFTFLQEGDTYYDNKDAATVLYPGGKTGDRPNGFSRVQSRFEYDPQDGKYHRFQYGGAQIDELTGEELAYDNVIFQYCYGEVRDEHDYLAFGCHGDNGYAVQVFTKGKVSNGIWKRADNSVPAQYIDYDGNPIPLSPGKTWVCIIWTDFVDDVVIE